MLVEVRFPRLQHDLCVTSSLPLEGCLRQSVLQHNNKADLHMDYLLKYRDSLVLVQATLFARLLSAHIAARRWRAPSARSSAPSLV